MNISEGMTCFLYLHVMIPIYTTAMPCVLPIVYLLVTDILKDVRSQVLLYRFYLSELCIKRSSTLTVWVSCTRHDTQNADYNAI